MTFYAHLGFSGLLKMPRMLQLLVQEFAQEKSNVNDSSVWFLQKVQKRAGDISQYRTILFYTSMPVWKWVLFCVQIGSLKQTSSVCPATFNVLYNCRRHFVLPLRRNVSHRFWLINPERRRCINIFLKDKNNNISMFGSPSCGAKAWFSHINHFEKRYCSCT